MFSALKKLGKNVKKAGKNMEEKFAKAGNAGKDGATSPSKHRNKDDARREDRKTHKDDDAKSKKSAKSKHDAHSRATSESDGATQRDNSERGSEARSAKASSPPSIPRRDPSAASAKLSKAKDTTKQDKESTKAMSETRSEAKPETPRAKTPLSSASARAHSPSPSDIAFQVEDVSPGPSMERPPSARVSRSPSIQLEEVVASPAKATSAAAERVTAAPPTKKSATFAEVAPSVHTADDDDTSRVNFQGDGDENETVDADTEHTRAPAPGETAPPDLLAETVRGSAREQASSSARSSSAARKTKPAPSAASTGSSHNPSGRSTARLLPPRDNQSSALKKRHVTVGDGGGGTDRTARTDAAFVRTENQRADLLGEDAHPIKARPTAEARYRSHGDKRTKTSLDTVTPERSSQGPCREAPEVVADLPDDSSTYVSPTRQSLHRRRHSSARASDIDEERDDDGGNKARDADRRQRRHHHCHRSHSAREARPEDRRSRDSGDFSDGEASSHRRERGQPSRHGKGAQDDHLEPQRRSRLASTQRAQHTHRSPTSPTRRDREAVLSARRYVSDPLDYREMMDQCRREARALSRRRARRVAYASDSELDVDMDGRYTEEDNVGHHPPSVSRRDDRRQRYRGFRDDADDRDEYDDEMAGVYNDLDRWSDERDAARGRNRDFNGGDSSDSRLEYDHNPVQREHYRRRRRFPGAYSGSPHQVSPRRDQPPTPDATRSDRTNVGRFYPAMIQEGQRDRVRDDFDEGAHRRRSTLRVHGGKALGPAADAMAGWAAESRPTHRAMPEGASRPRRSLSRLESGRTRQASNGFHSRDHTPRHSPVKRRSSLYTSPCTPQPLVPSARSASSRRASPMRAGSANVSREATTDTPIAGDAQQSEEALLEQIEFKMGLLAEQIAFEDEVREEDMRRNPFERLYHMNNRRDRDERRQRLGQYHKLEKLRDKLLTGAFEKDMAAQEAKRAVDAARLEDPNGVFNRLYKSPRRAASDSGLAADTSSVGPRHSRTSSADGSAAAAVPQRSSTPKLSKDAADALALRLYGGAVAAAKRREEERERAQKERELKEMEDFLVGRLVAGMERRLNGRVLTSDELHARAREELEKRMKANPDGTEQELVRGARLKKRDIEAQAKRLARHGYVSKEALAAQKKKAELTGCTFEPTINDYYFYDAGADVEKSGAGRNTPRQAGTLDASSVSAGAAARPQRTDVLYARAAKEKQAAELRRQEYDREMRLKILHSRMASDHHFRRRVELDPGLAERFMKSIVI